MDRTQRSRSRKEEAPPRRPQTQTRPAQRRPQQNPQKPGYRAASPRRVTTAEKRRRRYRTMVFRIIGVLLVGAFGALFSIKLLFNVTGYRIETMEHTTPADTGIYTEQEIIDALGVAVGDNLYSFNSDEKAEALLQQLPYLDEADVSPQAPGTVIIRVKPAVERFKMEYNGSWLVLSDQLKVLRLLLEEPGGLIVLDANLPEGTDTTPGRYLTLATEDSLATPTPDADSGGDADSAAAQETQTTAAEVLAELVDALDACGLFDGVTMLNVQDISNLSFLYGGRISVQLGTVNNLDYKMLWAAYIILNVNNDGLTSSERGTLDISTQLDDGSIQPRFTPDESTASTEAFDLSTIDPSAITGEIGESDYIQMTD